MSGRSIFKNLDWLSVLIYLALSAIGWVCIYATNYDANKTEFFSLSQYHTKQLIFILSGLVFVVLILSVESKFYERFSSLAYVFCLILLLGLFPFGKTINGAKAWYSLGVITIQPAEFAKVATALVFAKQLSSIQTDIRRLPDLLKTLLIIVLPCLLIILQPDPGSVLVYASFIFVLYREGLPGVFVFLLILFGILFIATLKYGVGSTIVVFFFLVLLYGYWVKRRTKRIPLKNMFILAGICVAISLSTSAVFHKVFKQHHRDRFSLWLRLDNDITRSEKLYKTVGYNTLQSVSAISSGGISGKGFLEGTRTKGGFVPEQYTDYIFTTLGEEWGFYGTATVVLLFTCLILRTWYIAERQRTKFARIYGYCVASIFFIHFFVNVGMVIGILPTVGIPLPFFSSGGSGFWGFTILLFILLRLDADRDSSWLSGY